MSTHNEAAIRMLHDRYSAHVQRFNSYDDVSDDDADDHYFAFRELADLAEAALLRAPLIEARNGGRLMVSRDLGDICRSMKKEFTFDEHLWYDDLYKKIEALTNKYGI